jgi:hypothetical protein
MNGHVAGPLVRGQKVRVVLLGTVERSHGGWELYCGGETVALDSEAIVNIQFIDSEQPPAPKPHSEYRCLSPHTEIGPKGSIPAMWWCQLPKGHGCCHESDDGQTKLVWP